MGCQLTLAAHLCFLGVFWSYTNQIYELYVWYRVTHIFILNSNQCEFYLYL
jgi:hypothetical protein